MNAMLGWLAIIEEERRRPGRASRTRLEIIERNARAQAKLIEDLLDMNRLMTGNVQLELDAVDLAASPSPPCRRCARPPMPSRVRLAVEAQNTGGLVNGDGRRLQQVLWNLVHNAVKFTPAGGQVTVGVPTAPTTRCAWWSPTAAAASRRSSCRTSSNGSGRRTPRRRGRRTASDWACRSPGISPNCTAGRSGRPARAPGTAPAASTRGPPAGTVRRSMRQERRRDPAAVVGGRPAARYRPRGAGPP